MSRPLPGLLALCLLATLPPFLAANEKDAPKSTLDPELRKALDAIGKDIQLLGQSIQSVRADLRLDLDALRLRMETLEKRVDAMQKVRVQDSAFPSTGTIVLENRLDVPATFIVDGVPYRVAARDVRTLTSYEARGFSYEILAEGFGQLQGPVTRTLRPNHTFRIWTYLP